MLTSIPTTQVMDIWAVKPEIGEVDTPYQARPIAEELALCQRYYQKSYVELFSGVIYAPNGDTRSTPIALPVTMRTVPAAFGANSNSSMLWTGENSTGVNQPTVNYYPFKTTVSSYHIGISYDLASAPFQGSTVVAFGARCEMNTALDAEIY